MQRPPTVIGHVRHDHAGVPRHWSISDLEGVLEIDEVYRDGLSDVAVGQRIIVLFEFDRSPRFEPGEHLRQTPPHRDHDRGVFSICSPLRPTPIGLSVVEVVAVDDCRLTVKGIDMYDGTPILDLKPYFAAPEG